MYRFALVLAFLLIACLPQESDISRIFPPITRGWAFGNLALTFFSKFVLFRFCFFRAAPQHMEVPRLGVESELQMPAYAAATVMWDPSHICDLYHNSWQCQILNPLSKARD